MKHHVIHLVLSLILTVIGCTTSQPAAPQPQHLPDNVRLKPNLRSSGFNFTHEKEGQKKDEMPTEVEKRAWGNALKGLTTQASR